MNTGLQHIAFIMDGNRRWAVDKGLSKLEGHTQGLENFKHIVRECSALNIPFLTFWALSTENLKKRSAGELAHLFKLLGSIREFMKDLVEHDARVMIIGDISKLPQWLRSVLNDIVQKTKNHARMTVTLAINYGGKDEILRAAKKAVAAAKSPSQISEKYFDTLIDSGFLPPVDLMIRTGGHTRLSGFLPWIADYAELYFTDTYWPDFTKKHLMRAIGWFDEQPRNFGK